MSADRERPSQTGPGLQKGRKTASSGGVQKKQIVRDMGPSAQPVASSSSVAISNVPQNNFARSESISTANLAQDPTRRVGNPMPTHAPSSVGKAHKSTRTESNKNSNTPRITATKTLAASGFASKSTVSSASKSISSPQRHGSTSQSIPSRVRFAQQKSPSRQSRSSFPTISSKVISPATPTAVRKSGSASFQARRHTQIAAAPPTPLVSLSFPAKTSKPLLPLWQKLDEEHEERVRLNKRGRDSDAGGFARRISSSTGRRGGAKGIDPDVSRLDVNDPNRTRARIATRLKLRVEGEPESPDSDGDEPRYRPQPRVGSRKVAGPQVATRKSAARKIEYINATSSDSESDKSMRTKSDIDELDPDQYNSPPPPQSTAKDVEMHEPVESAAPLEILLLDTPPRITIPLPQLNPTPANDAVDQSGPSEDLIAAVESLTLSSIRMQGTRQLPFLSRNLRQGFLKRCRDLAIPIYSDDRDISLSVIYEYVDGVTYQAEISDWLCPLCDLFGAFQTRSMLDCHISWDHVEVFYEWDKVDLTEETESWKLQILVPEIHEEREHVIRHSSPPVSNAEQDEEEESAPVKEEEEESTPEILDREQLLQTPVSRNILSPFPSVSLSPPSTRRPTRSETVTTPSKSPFPLPKIEAYQASSTRQTDSREPLSSVVSPSRRSTTQPVSSSRGRSATGTSLTTTTTTTTGTARLARDSRYPTPPPPDNPLGPAAQYPYLPAVSDYGGPTVYYSCRPGGPWLFDLLGTLPMKQFGVLDWDVLDRDEEIYESDDVKEEYKVMHALWARWIMLNRNKFISNYFEGTISFVNDYWKIIHRAAGWDALRYWLLILLANQFLNAHDLGKVLLHYEDLTGMASWYD